MSPISPNSRSNVFTIGHSSLAIDSFIRLLKLHRVTAVADVRSMPFSRRYPWFSKREFKESLRDSNIAYVAMGAELGGRPNAEALLSDGVADYNAMAATSEFKHGLARILRGSERYKIALTCSERDPLHCHRCLLVSRNLLSLGVTSTHIHGDGRLETQADAESRLLSEEQLVEDDFLLSDDDRLALAYEKRRKRVAFGAATGEEIST